MLEYTGDNVARLLLKHARLKSPGRIVDFCAGRGDLLLAAKRRWPLAKLYANDSDIKVFKALQQAYWVCGDFLDRDFRSNELCQIPSKFDLILLNPPFSSNGSPSHYSCEATRDLKCSLAFAFLLTSLEYLDDTGELLAILPTSTLHSDRDAEARRFLEIGFACQVIEAPNYCRFPGLDVSTYMLRVRRRRMPRRVQNEGNSQRNLPWTISRGKISVVRKQRTVQVGLHGWLHTSGIKDSIVSVRYALPNKYRVSDQLFVPRGALIIPRVGKFGPGNLIVSKRREILSDCLFGIVFDNPAHSRQALKSIMSDFASFARLYAGTGAPYTTKLKISNFLWSTLLEKEAREARSNQSNTTV